MTMMMNKRDYSRLELPNKETMDKLHLYYTREWDKLQTRELPKWIILWVPPILWLVAVVIVGGLLYV